MTLDATTDGVARAQAREAGPASRRGGWASSSLLWRLLSVALFLGLWEAASRSGLNYAFPSATETIAAFFRLLFDGSLLAAYGRTLQPLVLGVVISAIVGVGLGVWMGLKPTVEWLAAPLFVVLQAAPVAALIPLITFVYGIGLLSKVLAVIVLALPVIVLNSYKAVQNVSPSLVAMSRSFLATPLQTVRQVILPDASPMIFAGLRLGIAAGFIGIVLAELLITPTGIGDLITYHRSVADYAEMYAVIVSIIVVAAVTVSLLEAVETAVFRPEKRKAPA